MKAFWLEDSEESTISSLELDAQGVHNQVLPCEPSGYQPPLDILKQDQGYHTQDEVCLSPDLPELEAICAKFIDEHYHDEDEVRFVLDGSGVFDIRATDERWMRVEVQAGDLIVVPARRYHRFFLTEEKMIRCVRLFQDASGWVPHYRKSA